MTKDEVIAMARKAGGADVHSHGFVSWVGTQSMEFLERFAAAVIEHERERCASIVEKEAMTYAEPVWALRLVARIRNWKHL